MPLVFVFIGLLPFTELAMELEVRDMPGSSGVSLSPGVLALGAASEASPILGFSSPVGKLFSALRVVHQWKGCEEGPSSLPETGILLSGSLPLHCF